MSRFPPSRVPRVLAKCKSCEREFSADSFEEFDLVMVAEKCACGGEVVVTL